MAVATTSTKSRVRKGDTVVILSGKDRGKQGKVLQVMPAASKVVVEKLNLFKRHTKPGKANKGGIIEKERALQLAKVMVLCPHCSAPSRLGVALLENGKRLRRCKSCGEIVDKG
ncbi:MAG: 50S ribosomal protein L24 [Nitrospiria bacterium]